jgi:hypothetical protein
MPSSSDQTPPKERSAYDINPYYQEEFLKARLAGDKSKHSRRSREDWHEGENVNKERASRSVPKEL